MRVAVFYAVFAKSDPKSILLVSATNRASSCEGSRQLSGSSQPRHRLVKSSRDRRGWLLEVLLPPLRDFVNGAGYSKSTYRLAAVAKPAKAWLTSSNGPRSQASP